MSRKIDDICIIYRYASIDYIKGWLILLVIVGHLLLYSPLEKFLFYMIYSFHMPLLLGISGYLIKKSKISSFNFRQLTQSYWHKMLLPWVMALVVYTGLPLVRRILMGSSSPSEIFLLVIYPEIHLWYIPALMMMIIALFFLERIGINPFALLVISGIFTITLKTVLSPYPLWGWPTGLAWLGEKRTYIYFYFFYLGYWIRNYIPWFSLSPRILIVFIACMFILILMNFLMTFPSAVIAVLWFALNTGLILFVHSIKDKQNWPGFLFFGLLASIILPLYLWHYFPIWLMLKTNLAEVSPDSFYGIAVFFNVLLILFLKYILKSDDRFARTLKPFILGDRT